MHVTKKCYGVITMSDINRTRQIIAGWVIVANLIAFTAVMTSLCINSASAHDDELHQHIITKSDVTMVDGRMMVDLSLTNYSGKEINIQALSIDGVKLSSIGQTLADSANLQFTGSQSVEIPQRYLGSMFLALELDLGRDGTMTIPVIVSNDFTPRSEIVTQLTPPT